MPWWGWLLVGMLLGGILLAVGIWVGLVWYFTHDNKM